MNDPLTDTVPPAAVPSPAVTVLAGGVGAARMLRGIISVVDAADVVAVVNTGDDTVLHGLEISPDLDTIVYTLAGAIDPERGWGLASETWAAMAALERYEDVRPDGSTAAPRWFNLGDRDLATHFYRTARRREGARATTVAGEIARAWGVDLTVLPMCDEPLRTVVELGDGTEVSFQDYFVRLRHSVPIRRVEFRHDGAHLTDEVRRALTDAATVVIAPSNPIVSIGPIRALVDTDELLASRRRSVVAVSPIVGGAALKGPADRMLEELGMTSDVVAVAELYAPIAATLVIDPADEHLADRVEAAGMRCVITPSVMSSPQVAAELARVTIAAASG